MLTVLVPTGMMAAALSTPPHNKQLLAVYLLLL